MGWKKTVGTGIVVVAFLIRCIDNPQSSRPPSITVTADSVVTVGDTMTIAVAGEGADDTDPRYCLLREGTWEVDTFTDAPFGIVWHFPDTGRQHLVVWTVDASGGSSECDTLTVDVEYFAPTVYLDGNERAGVHEWVTVHAAGNDSDGTIAWYEWLVDGTERHITADDEDSLVLRWGVADTGCHKVSVTAVDNDGLPSQPDTFEICVSLSAPLLVLSGDTLVSVNDSARFICSVNNDAITVREYQWSVDNEGDVWFASSSDTLIHRWLFPDTGMQVLRVRVVDNKGVLSVPESLSVTVYAAFPVVTCDGKRAVMADDTVTLTVSGNDGDGVIIGYLWKISSARGDTSLETADTAVRYVWTEADLGVHTVSVVAIDDDSLHSAAAVCSVTVKSEKPLLQSFNDTTLSSNDTIVVVRTLADTAQTVERWYWDFDGVEGWDDSSETSVCNVFYRGLSPVRLATGVRNNEGMLFSDTITVTFNRPPTIESLSLLDGDTIWMSASALPGSVAFDYTINDRDGDSLETSLTWGRVTHDTIRCTDTTVLPVDSVGSYQWRIRIVDQWGHLLERSGTTCVGREYTVCFAGHSIIVGLLGDDVNGGFRAKVLAGLRDSCGVLERIRPVGPLVTFYLQNTIDDSCFAISGSFAREMDRLMDAYTELTADIWVLMLGVNGGFTVANETTPTLNMVRKMFERNNSARVYILTSPPFANAAVNRRLYNDSLRAAAGYWTENGFSAYIVEADSVLSDGSVITDTLFNADGVHPNQDGYDAVGDEILRVMWSNEPTPFPVKHDAIIE